MGLGCSCSPNVPFATPSSSQHSHHHRLRFAVSIFSLTELQIALCAPVTIISFGLPIQLHPVPCNSLLVTGCGEQLLPSNRENFSYFISYLPEFFHFLFIFFSFFFLGWSGPCFHWSLHGNRSIGWYVSCFTHISLTHLQIPGYPDPRPPLSLNLELEWKIKELKSTWKV